MKKMLCFLVCILFSLSAVAANNTHTAKNHFTCPPIKDIHKDPKTYTWYDKRGFKSYNQSFVDQIKKFNGAQWSGTRVGQITCVYKGRDPNSFPILLIFHTLTKEPTGAKWGSNNGGYRDCRSSNQKDCPFEIQLKPKQGDIYKEAEGLRQNPSTTDQ